MQTTVRLMFAAIVANVQAVLILRDNDDKRIHENVMSSIIHGDNFSFATSPSYPLNNHKDYEVHFILPAISPIATVDDLFRNPHPKSSNTVKYSSIKRCFETIKALTIADDIRIKMLEIVTSFQTQQDDDFVSSRVYRSLNFIRAYAWLNRNDVVEPSDLWTMTCLWTDPINKYAYEEIVYSIVDSYNTIANAYNEKVGQLKSRFLSAKNAVSTGKPINFYDSKINAGASLDNIITESLGEITVIEAELQARVDGKSKSNKNARPLFDTLDAIGEFQRELAAAKGIRV
jgi:hypothetical protein